MLRDVLGLFKHLPGSLKITWGMLVVGMILAGSGYLFSSAWQSITGVALLAAGFMAAMMDLIIRRRDRGRAAPFYAGLVVAPMIGLMFTLFVAFLAAGVFLFFSVTRGYAEERALRLLHFIAVVFGFAVIIGIPAIAQSARGTENRDESAEKSGEEG